MKHIVAAGGRHGRGGRRAGPRPDDHVPRSRPLGPFTTSSPDGHHIPTARRPNNRAVRALAVACLLLLAPALAGLRTGAAVRRAARRRHDGEEETTARRLRGGSARPGRLSRRRLEHRRAAVSLAAERFRKAEPGVKVTVGDSGTGGGFERFCRGETDLSNASRPIEDEEKAALRQEAASSFPSSRSRTTASRSWSTRTTTGPTCLTVDQLQEDLGAGVEGRQLAGHRPVVPRRGARALRRRHRLGHVRLLHRGDRRRGRRQPQRLHRRARTTTSRCSGVSGVKGALGYFGLSYYEREQGEAEGARGRRRRRLRRARASRRSRTARTSRCRARSSST